MEDVDPLAAERHGKRAPRPHGRAMCPVEGDHRHCGRVEDLAERRPWVSARRADDRIEAVAVEVGGDCDRDALGTSGPERVEQRQNPQWPRPDVSPHSPRMVPLTAMGSLQQTVLGEEALAGLVSAEMSVPGFVVLVSDDRDAAVSQDDVDRFAAAYEALCGHAPRRSYTADSFAHVIEFSRDAVPDSTGADRGSWSVVAGVAHGAEDGSLPDAAALEGQFALVTYEEQSRTLTVATDPFGLFPLYHGSREGTHYFSTSALAIAKHLAAPPDVLGLFVYLRAGYHFGARTHWQDVERVEPGHRMVFAPHGSRVERYWRQEPDESVTRLNLQATARFCVHACVETFGKLYAHGDPVWADLTGGYDTRLLTAALSRAGVRFRTNTVGPEWREDVQIARMVAEAGEFEWTRFSPYLDAADDFTAHFARALAAGHGHLDALQLIGVLATHDAKRADLDRLLTGGGGEQFQYQTWLTEYAQAGRTTNVNVDKWVRMRLLATPVDTSIFAGYSASDVEGDLRDRCVAWIAPYRNEVNTLQLDLLYAYKMMGHFGAYTGASSSVMRSELPFYMRPVAVAGLSTGHRHRNRHRLMQHMIHELMPEVAAVRTSKGGPAQPMRLGNVHRFLPYYGRLASKVVKKATGVHVYSPRGQRRVPIPTEVRVAARTMLGDVRSFRSQALYRRDELEDMVADAAQPEFAHATLFGRIATVEAALRAVDVEVSRDVA
jgi:Glutamine amidotransferase domain